MVVWCWQGPVACCWALGFPQTALATQPLALTSPGVLRIEDARAYAHTTRWEGIVRRLDLPSAALEMKLTAVTLRGGARITHGLPATKVVVVEGTTTISKGSNLMGVTGLDRLTPGTRIVVYGPEEGPEREVSAEAISIRPAGWGMTTPAPRGTPRGVRPRPAVKAPVVFTSNMKYSFRPPPGWVRVDSSAPNDDRVAFRANAARRLQVPLLTITARPSPHPTLQALRSEIVAATPREFVQFRLLSQSATRLGNSPAFVMTFRYMHDSGVYQGRQIVGMRSELAYTIYFVAPADQFPKVAPAVEKSLKSFRWVK